jgi:hypothetical protein
MTGINDSGYSSGMLSFSCGGLFLVEDDAYPLNVAEQIRIRNVRKDRQIDFVGQ